MSSACNASAISQFFSGNYLLCKQQPQLIQQEQAEIQSVATNASTYYGADSTTAQVAQAAADSQSKYAVQDVADITQMNASDCNGVDLSLLGLDCVEWWKIYIVIGAIVALVLLPYTLPFLLPRRG